MSIQRYGKWDFRTVDDAAASRASAHYTRRGAPPEPERASAVVLLREAPLRVYLLRQTAKEPFDFDRERHGRTGRYGFPGGRYKPDDPDVAMTGVRAVEEETGAMVALQRAWARWVTPEFEPVRFDAWIYVATLAEGFQPRVRMREPEYATWISPEQAVCQYGGYMSVPEATTLAELSRYSTVGEVFAAAEQRDMSPILPRVSFAPGKPRLLLPGEEGYPTSAEALSRN